MRNPAIQNDFSYYRRTISRNRINNINLDIESEVNNEMANRMSLSYAEATPMLKTFSNASTNFVTEMKGCIKVLKNQPSDNVEGLLNALKFTTKHLNDKNTPKNI